MSIVHSAAALIIGTEILSGKVTEENIRPLSRVLRGRGIPLERVLMIPDEKELLIKEIQQLSSQFELVVTSGGIGPTHDDLTVHCAAAALGRKVVRDPQLTELAEEHFGRSLSEGEARLTEVPEGAELMSAPHLKWPALRIENLWLLPGVPQYFQEKLKAIEHHLQGPSAIHSAEILCRSDELSLLGPITELVAAFPGVEIGCYPLFFSEYGKTRLTFDGQDQELIELCLQKARELFAEEILEETSTEAPS